MILTENTQSNAGKGSPIWEGTEVLAAGQTGEPVILPGEAGAVDYWNVGLAITTGTGKIQYTLSGRDSVLLGTATWKDWDPGTVSSTADDSLYPVAAVRGVCVSGTITLEVLVS